MFDFESSFEESNTTNEDEWCAVCPHKDHGTEGCVAGIFTTCGCIGFDLKHNCKTNPICIARGFAS